ncbi:MAG TPA: SpoIIE family protein phosphatase [Pirellulales bacterium]|nr:SpoIIE family protein phosphatase [Pirellulales bacterium]
MRVLVGWDDEEETDLLTMYLEAGGTQVRVTRSPDELLAAFETEACDVVLLPITFPDSDQAFDLFEKIRRANPDMPVMVAARPGEIYPLSRFIGHGVQAHIYRDPAKEYLFLLQTLLESALKARQAEQARLLAEKLRSEVDSVRKLQESMIPRNMEAPLGYEIVARYEPSQINVSGGQPVVLAGGDYYYAFKLSGQRLVFLVGDASGHGIKACMSIMGMHTLISMLQDDLHAAPHEFVKQINRRLCIQNLVQDQEGFITLVYGVLEDGVLRWTSAGHCVPLLQDMETGKTVEIGDPTRDGGLPLGIYDDADYETMATEIPPGHRLVVYTDGIIEAMSNGSEHKQFGIEGLRRTLHACRRQPLSRTLDELFRESMEFTGGEGRHDDTSVLLLERRLDD